MERWRGRTVLVTGASAGIGYAIAETLCQSGMNVIGCARRSEKIEQLAASMKGSSGAGSVTAMKCDLSKEEEILTMFKNIEGTFKHVDILVNNAGLGHADDLITGRTDKWKQMLDVNIMALSICTREALRLMKNSGVDDGHIININSTAGHTVGASPVSHFYTGTKHMVTALTKALNAELRQQKSKIRVTSLSPGIVDTEFADVRKAGSDQQNPDTKTNLEQFHAYRDSVQPLTSQDIADAVLYIVGVPPHVNVRELSIAPTDQAM